MNKFRVLLASTALLSAAVGLPGQVKRPVPVGERVPFSRSLQAVVVTTPSWAAVSGTGQRFERKRAGSKWRPAGDSFPVVVGRNGLAADPEVAAVMGAPAKHEGDGKAPAGMFPLTFAFGTAAETAMPFTNLEEFTECVDDVKSSHYNTVVNRMKVGNFDWHSSEKMLAVGGQYERGVFVAYNSFPAVKGNGSCIFLHIWKSPETGTAGCTAMKRQDLETILGWLQPSKNPYLVQMPAGTYNSNRRSWKLPKLK
jgi:D-alanyl-D-alanine dipeptidase